MAGGAGTRLWPMSRDEKPKQFLNLSGKGTLLEETIARLFSLKPENLVVVTSKKYEALSKDEIKKCGLNGVVLCEPRPRNTAAAVLYAALYCERSIGGDAVMIILPADHYIKQRETFADVLRTGVAEAEKGHLVTIGILPSYPETGYGYIKALENEGNVRTVDRFVEKPDLEKAKSYVSAGGYYWNSGIFLWRVSSILDAFKKYLPHFIEIFAPLTKFSPGEICSDSPDVWDIKNGIFNALDSVSIDYGIMEKSDNVVVIPADFGWADLGSWKSIDDILAPDPDGNRAPDREKGVFVGSSNCSVFSEGLRISVVGLSDIVVVQAGDEILVINKDSSQDVRKVVDIVKKR